MMNMGKLQKRGYISLVFVMLSIFPAAGAVFELPIPDESHAGMTNERDVSGIYIDDNKTLIFNENLQQMTLASFNLSGATRDARFGTLLDQQRVMLKDAKYPGKWKGAFASDDRLYVWDATMLQILVLRAKDFVTVQSTSVPTDTIRPAADKQGEPTTYEIRKLRQEYKANSRKTFGVKFTGLAEIPRSWTKSKERLFLVASRVKSFPLMIMTCKRDDPSICVLDRKCFVEGDARRVPTGVGVIETERKIVLGYADQHEIGIYRYDSCFNVVYERAIKMPARLPKMSDLTVDKKNRLVVSTAVMDQFTNGQVFFWEPEQWLDRSK